MSIVRNTFVAAAACVPLVAATPHAEASSVTGFLEIKTEGAKAAFGAATGESGVWARLTGTFLTENTIPGMGANTPAPAWLAEAVLTGEDLPFPTGPQTRTTGTLTEVQGGPLSFNELREEYSPPPLGPSTAQNSLFTPFFYVLSAINDALPFACGATCPLGATGSGVLAGTPVTWNVFDGSFVSSPGLVTSESKFDIQFGLTNDPDNPYGGFTGVFADLLFPDFANDPNNVLDIQAALLHGPEGQGSTIDFFASTRVSVIPVPAALPLLAGGLAVFGVVGWRRRRAQAA